MHARDNPFRVECVLKIRYCFAIGDLTTLLSRWTECGNRGAIVGPEGSGKTTLLEDLMAPLRERGFHPWLLQLRRDDPSRRWREHRFGEHGLSRHHVLLVDGAEQLSWVQWRQFRWSTRSAGGIFIASHNAGRLPTIWECSTSPALLFRIATALAPDADFSQAALSNLYHRHGGNLREALRELYDRQAGVVGNRSGVPTQIGRQTGDRTDFGGFRPVGRAKILDSSAATCAEGEKNALNGPDELLS